MRRRWGYSERARADGRRSAWPSCPGGGPLRAPASPPTTQQTVELSGIRGARSDALGVRWLADRPPGRPRAGLRAALRTPSCSASGRRRTAIPSSCSSTRSTRSPDHELGWKAVAAGLLGRPQEVKRAAVDVVVAAISDGRFDADRLARRLAWLVANDLGKASRLEQPLRDAGARLARHATAGRACGRRRSPRRARRRRTGSSGRSTAANELAASDGLRAEGRAERAALERIAAEVSASSKLAARRAGSSAARRVSERRQRVTSSPCCAPSRRPAASSPSRLRQRPWPRFRLAVLVAGVPLRLARDLVRLALQPLACDHPSRPLSL